MAWIVIKKSDLSIISMSSIETTFDPSLADFCTARSLTEADYYKITHTVENIINYGADITDEGAGVYSAAAKSAPTASVAKRIVLSSDASDTTPANGIKELVANGTANCSISAQLQVETSAGSSVYVDESTAAVDVTFTTSSGKLSASVDASDASGLSIVTLTSNIDTIRISLSAYAVGYESSTILMEFTPVI